MMLSGCSPSAGTENGICLCSIPRLAYPRIVASGFFWFVTQSTALIPCSRNKCKSHPFIQLEI